MSNTGGGLGDRPPPYDGGSGKGNLGDFFDPEKSSSESDNLKRARAELSDSNLPLSFDNNDDDSNNNNTNTQETQEDSTTTTTTTSKTSIQKKRNPYLDVVSTLSPSEIISKFTSTAHPRVQDAVRTTVLGLIGNLPQMAFDTTTVTTGKRLASLMFQLQMTGYMFKNAEYRLSLSQSLSGSGGSGGSRFLLEDGDDGLVGGGRGKVRGKIKVSYGGTTPTPTPTTKEEKKSKNDNNDTSPNPMMEVEVDAEAFTSELRSEVTKLREELTKKQAEKEEAIRKDLLLYIRTLPEQELQSLTETMSSDVLEAMKGLVNAVVAGVGNNSGGSGEEEVVIGPDTMTEQSGEAMAQLCMWQLVVGYNLRELEVREEIRKVALLRGDEGRQQQQEGDVEDDDDVGDSILE